MARVPNERLKLPKSRQRLTSIASRNKADNYGPRPDENVSEMRVPGRRGTTEVLVDVESVASNNIFWGAKGTELDLVDGKKEERLRKTICDTGIPTVISRSTITSRRFCKRGVE